MKGGSSFAEEHLAATLCHRISFSTAQKLVSGLSCVSLLSKLGTCDGVPVGPPPPRHSVSCEGPQDTFPRCVLPRLSVSGWHVCLSPEVVLKAKFLCL